MIIKFSVQNFGSIKDEQTLSFEADKSTHLEDHYVINVLGMRLLKLALIYGANASGKTTILEALNFLKMLVDHPKSNKTELLDFQPFLFDGETPKQNTIFKIDFIQKEVRYYYEVELNKQAIVREELYYYSPNRANVFKRITNLETQFTEITFGGKIKVDKVAEKILEANTLWNNTVLAGFLKTNIDIKELKDAADWFQAYLNILLSPKHNVDNVISEQLDRAIITPKDILQILRKADFNVSDIQLEKRGELDYKIDFEHTLDGNKYTLPFQFESLGTQRYYSLTGLLAFVLKYSMVLPIDELESSLHPDLYMHFLLSFLMNSKNGSQLIATTHNREILNNRDIFRNDAIWITDKSEGCATELYSLADFDSSVIRDTSNVYNAYKIGKLGGIPNLGDYYIDLEE